jgi:hypothetical protein
MTGYSNPIVHIPFIELMSDTEDPIWVSIRNPRLMSPQELQPKPIAMDDKGQPVDPLDARNAMNDVIAKLIVGWRVYDPASIKVDDNTGELLPMERFPSPATPTLVARLPVAIITKLAEEVTSAMNPPSGSADTTTKTSSSPPSPSTTEHGQVG